MKQQDTSPLLLPRTQAMRWIDAYTTVLLEILRIARQKRGPRLTEDLVAARSHAAQHPTTWEQALERLRSRGEPQDAEIEAAIRSLRVGRWIHLRHTTRYALLLDAQAEHAYATKALTDPLHEIIGNQAFVFEAAVFAYRGCHVCDGLIANPVLLGKGLRESLKTTYTRIKEEGRFHLAPPGTEV